MANTATIDDVNAAYDSFKADVKKRLDDLGAKLAAATTANTAGDQAKTQALLDEINTDHAALLAQVSGDSPQQPAAGDTGTGSTEETVGGN